MSAQHSEWIREGKFILALTQRGVDIFWADDCLTHTVDPHTGRVAEWFTSGNELTFMPFASYEAAQLYLQGRDDKRWRSNADYLEAYR